ncbi:MAG: type III-B CRISPR-associated protein Cas10/Cmr2 [Venatoribacter sp.]
MTDYVVILSVGPVQSLIAAARKSRDLWSGSGLLSELAKACAYSLYAQGADLIFPAVNKSNEQDLLPNSDFSVGNKIQAIVSAADLSSLKNTVEKAKQAAKQRFIDEANKVLEELPVQDTREAIWQAQLKDYVEVQAAWAVLKSAENYSEAVGLASSALAARKATRDFSPAATNPYDSALMLPKSSLDGARETVLTEKTQNRTRLKLGLSDSEQLDCMGVVKRLGLKEVAEQFTPFSRIAADAWLRDIEEKTPELLAPVNAAYEKLVKADLATRVKGNKGIYSALPFDGQLLYRSRFDAAVRDGKHDSETSQLLSEFKSAIKPLWDSYKQPNSYGVLLLADGDRMGELLDKAKTVAAHKEITQALSNFAGSVAEAMRRYFGHCIYAGGDDVLGFVPLNTAYVCAQALSELFTQSLKAIADKLEAPVPTLSVGLAIEHHVTPLSSIRALASQAEAFAKGDHINDAVKRRNALGICLDVRSGNVTKLRFSWADTDAHKTFNYWIGLYQQKSLPSRIAYDTRAVGMRTAGVAQNPEVQRGIEGAEFKRMLEHSRTNKGEKVNKEHIAILLKRAGEIGLQALADELIVARWLAARTQQDLGKDGE